MESDRDPEPQKWRDTEPKEKIFSTSSTPDLFNCFYFVNLFTDCVSSMLDLESIIVLSKHPLSLGTLPGPVKGFRIRTDLK